MNYKNIYDNLINKVKSRHIEDYVEKHHIVPKCMGGDNTQNNIVKLTPEEHYVAHQLLSKIYPENRKLLIAMSAMTFDRSGCRQNNKMYGWIRRKLAKSWSDEKKGKQTWMKGKSHTIEVKEKLSMDKKILGIKPPSQAGSVLSEDRKRYLSEFWKGKKKPPRTKEHSEKIAVKIRGTKASEETRKKLSEIKTGKKFQIVKCPFCDKTGGYSGMGRWHFDNCKYKIEN